MVRVGGGWDILDHFLLKHDPCRIHAISGMHAWKMKSSDQVVPLCEMVLSTLLYKGERLIRRLPVFCFLINN